MAEKTSIEWCDSTWNPWIGCQKVSPACDHCYAETFTTRFGQVEWGPGKPRKRTSAANWRKPLKWNRDAAAFAEKHGRRQRVFCASLADVFDNAVDPQWRADLFALIDATPDLDWLLLTKRIGNVAGMLEAMGRECLPPHVWLGATICNQEEADRDVPKLLDTPAAVRFLSCEPLLAPVDLTWIAEPDEEKDGVIDALLGCNWVERVGDDYRPTRPGHEGRRMGRWVVSGFDDIIANRKIDWIIVGGESGAGARDNGFEANARSLLAQCQSANVACFIKQNVKKAPLPTDLMVREFPQ